MALLLACVPIAGRTAAHYYLPAPPRPPRAPELFSTFSKKQGQGRSGLNRVVVPRTAAAGHAGGCCVSRPGDRLPRPRLHPAQRVRAARAGVRARGDFRLGRLVGARICGSFFPDPARRTHAEDPTCGQRSVSCTSGETITRDNVQLKVDAVDLLPSGGRFGVGGHQGARLQPRHLTHRADHDAEHHGQSDGTSCCAHREHINSQLQAILDQETEPWGLKVAAWRSAMCRCRNPCAAPWRDRRRPNARSAGEDDPRGGRARPRPRSSAAAHRRHRAAHWGLRLLQDTEVAADEPDGRLPATHRPYWVAGRLRLPAR